MSMNNLLPHIMPPTNPNLASEFYERLINWINEFHRSLDDEFEVGVRLVNFGQTVTFHIEDIGYWNPSLISFKGKTEVGEPVELIQHVSQISILLMIKNQTNMICHFIYSIKIILVTVFNLKIKRERFLIPKI